MRSYLTRQLCRRIILNEPIIYKGCLYKNSPRRYAGSVGPVQPQIARREFWTAFQRWPKKEESKPNLPPGLKFLHEMSENDSSARVEDVIAAIEKFSSWLVRGEKTFLGEHAGLVVNAIKFLNTSQEFSQKQRLPPKIVGQFITSLKSNAETSENHIDLAQELYSITRSLERPKDTQLINNYDEALRVVIMLLTRSGKSSEAQMLLLKNIEEYGKRPHMERVWHLLLSGYYREGNEDGIRSVLGELERSLTPLSKNSFGLIIQFYAERDNLEKARQWYDELLKAGFDRPPSQTFDIALRSCIRNGHVEWGNAICRSIADKNVSKDVWGSVLVFAALTGKGVEGIARLMDVMIEQSRNFETSLEPDSGTINRLIEFSMSRNDPYTSERYVHLGERRNIKPDAQTYGLQIEYRLMINDIKGALGAVRNLCDEQDWNEQSARAVNKLVRTLCTARKNDLDTIFELVQTLNKRKHKLEAKTAAALCIMHLGRGELHEVIDLLGVHALKYTGGERRIICEALVSLCLAPNLPVTRIWDTYMICRHRFDAELDLDERTRVMQLFFQHSRPDMACYVFGHMRQHVFPRFRPTAETYTIFFDGTAACRDSESLGIVHNQLKLDATVEPCTRLLNSLMLAYTRCGMPERAFEFWEEIVGSREGPSYESIKFVLRACWDTAFGDRQAKNIWQRLIGMDVTLPRDILAMYVGAIMSHERLVDAISVLECGLERFGHEADELL